MSVIQGIVYIDDIYTLMGLVLMMSVVRRFLYCHGRHDVNILYINGIGLVGIRCTGDSTLEYFYAKHDIKVREIKRTVESLKT